MQLVLIDWQWTSKSMCWYDSSKIYKEKNKEVKSIQIIDILMWFYLYINQRFILINKWISQSIFINRKIYQTNKLKLVYKQS